MGWLETEALISLYAEKKSKQLGGGRHINTVLSNPVGVRDSSDATVSSMGVLKACKLKHVCALTLKLKIDLQCSCTLFES